MQTLVCLDLEGVLIPEIWIALAERFGVSELRLTTRDIADYDELMTKRLAILAGEHITLQDIQKVAADMAPLEGAPAFLRELRRRVQVVILSDTYIEFAAPLLEKIGNPLLLCNSLEVDSRGNIKNYILRTTEGKKRTVEAFKSIGYRLAACGDSFNDLGMILSAERGVLFRPPAVVRAQVPDIPAADSYDELLRLLIP